MFDKRTLTGALVLALLPLVSGSLTAQWKNATSTQKRLRSLAGDWSMSDASGEATDLRATYRVVAGGAAVIETLFAGTEEETVTIYHTEGARVTVTQLSRRGAPLRLVPADTDEDDTLRFEPSGAETARPGQPTGLQLTLLDDDRVRIEWLGPEARDFEFQRVSSVTELAAQVGRLRVDLDSLQRELDRRLKREVTVVQNGAPTEHLLETRTIPPGPGWVVTGVRLRRSLYEQTTPFASTFAAQGDKGMTVAHYGFKAGPGCRVRFSVLGGHAYIAVVEETRAPPRRIRSIPDFSLELDEGTYGPTIERFAGGHWTRDPRAVEWDLSRFEGKSLRLYIVDAETNHFGQIAISEISILETAPK